MRMVILGSSYRRNTMSRAGFAHDSPRKNAVSVPICGWSENRAEIAQTARMRTGGTVPALFSNLSPLKRKLSEHRYIP